MTNAVAIYHVTIPAEVGDKDMVIAWAEEYFKKWAFQKEAGGETGFEHYQFRGSLKKKLRLEGMGTLVNKTLGISRKAASIAHDDGWDYCFKNATRIDGPWKSWEDEDEEDYIPKKLRGSPVWNPLQGKIMGLLEHEPDDRTVYCLVDKRGCSGKSFIAKWLDCHKQAIYIPQFESAKELMRMCFGMPKRGCYIIDLPRATSMNGEHALYAGIEQLKTGLVYDDRYKYRRQWIDSPHVLVFTNREPDLSLLSADRWKILRIGAREEAVEPAVPPVTAN